MAHALRHWRYALNQTVLAWLAAEGYLTPAKIVERESLRQKKRQKATNKIVDGMEAAGVMQMLYKQFKENLAAARDAKVCSFLEKWYIRDLILISSSPRGTRTEIPSCIKIRALVLLSHLSVTIVLRRLRQGAVIVGMTHWHSLDPSSILGYSVAGKFLAYIGTLNRSVSTSKLLWVEYFSG